MAIGIPWGALMRKTWTLNGRPCAIISVAGIEAELIGVPNIVLGETLIYQWG